MALHLTAATDYGLRAMIHIASAPEGVVVPRQEIAAAQQIPSSFMAKILRRLVQGRLLSSTRGVNGGFVLSRSASQISMLEIVEALEGSLALTRCARHGTGCSLASECPGSVVWPLIQQHLGQALGMLSLEDLASAPRRHGRVTAPPALRQLEHLDADADSAPNSCMAPASCGGRRGDGDHSPS